MIKAETYLTINIYHKIIKSHSEQKNNVDIQ